jgi:hypothetical protein
VKPFRDDGRKSISSWVMTGEGSLKVGGSTNVNKFSCNITNFISPDTLFIEKDLYRETIKMSGSVHLDIKRFDCNNVVMTKDLRKALKAKDFPQMQIRFISLSWYPESYGNEKEVRGVVSISLAGVTKTFKISYIITQNSSTSMKIKGSWKISFSDFNIVPPAKLGGIVKANDELYIEFKLALVQL